MIKLKTLLPENFQLSQKVHAGKLSPEEIEFFEKLTNKDFTFKTLVDLYLEEKTWAGISLQRKQADWEMARDQLRNYNKNVFPVKNFSFDSSTPTITLSTIRYRKNIINHVRNWPKIAVRNLKDDIRKERNCNDFYKLDNVVDQISGYLSYLDNRTPVQKEKILRKIFSSNHATFDEILDFVEDKENLMSGQAYDKAGLYNLVKKNDYDLKIIYDKNNIVIVDVTGQPGIKLIGCNSMWCFTYGSEYGRAGEQWDQYSYNGHVYAIIDFKQRQDSSDFIHILTKPFDQQEGNDGEGNYDETHLYNMSNEQVYGNAKHTIVRIVGDKSILNLFKFEEI